VDQLLVLLQLAVVEKRLPTEVAHERLLHAVNQHVGLQSPGTREALSTFITPETETKNRLGFSFVREYIDLLFFTSYHHDQEIIMH